MVMMKNARRDFRTGGWSGLSPRRFRPPLTGPGGRRVFSPHGAQSGRLGGLLALTGQAQAHPVSGRVCGAAWGTLRADPTAHTTRKPMLLLRLSLVLRLAEARLPRSLLLNDAPRNPGRPPALLRQPG